MKERRETLMVATAVVLFGVVFGILFLACEQREDQPAARADAPAANAKPDSPPAPSASKVAERRRMSFNDIQIHVKDLGEQIEGFRGKATGDLAVDLGKLEAEQAKLMAELEAIGGDNEKWDAARARLVPEAHRLRGRVSEFRGRVNG